jgi:hypothetical protein
MRYTVVNNAAIKGRFYLAGATIEIVEEAARKYIESGMIKPALDESAGGAAIQQLIAPQTPANNRPKRKRGGGR